ncbi:G-protein coupled receptor 15-like [Hypanus sabinus]|uniref:G-protein coupled receptor 15-like n=1 Tax=Hypanus sabinus TaxID=79690 RepID=UPI0028C47B24|nr:G-protein coupled receptor 15-like [Hypanus sabinus]
MEELLLYCSVSANFVVIGVMLRRRCGLSRCFTFYLLSMAVTDLLVIITGAVLIRIVPMTYPSNLLTFSPGCNVNLAVAYGVRDCSVWVMVMFTFDRFVAICCQQLKTKYCTERTAKVVIGTVVAMSCFKNIFVFFEFEPAHNTEPTPCIVKTSYYTSPGWITYDWIDSILVPCAPLVLILLFNFITIRYIVRAIRVRRRLQNGGNSERQNDPEMESRRKSIVLLLSISGIFVLFWILVLVRFLYVRIANVYYFSGSNYSESIFPLEESSFLLQFLCSCVNPFIYAGTQSKIRDEIKLALKYPLTLLRKR